MDEHRARPRVPPDEIHDGHHLCGGRSRLQSGEGIGKGPCKDNPSPLASARKIDGDTRLIWDTLSADISGMRNAARSAKNHDRDPEPGAHRSGRRRNRDVAVRQAVAITNRMLALNDRARASSPGRGTFESRITRCRVTAWSASRRERFRISVLRGELVQRLPYEAEVEWSWHKAKLRRRCR